MLQPSRLTNLKSIMAGFVTAAPLFAFMWLTVGTRYAQSVRLDAGTTLVLAFWGGLMPDTLVVAFVAGVVVGVFPGAGRLVKAETRAAAAGLLFAIAVVPALMLVVKPDVGGGWPPTSFARLGELCLMCLFTVPFSAMGAFPFLFPAAAGGWCGDRLAFAARPQRRAILACLIGGAAGLIAMHAWVVRSSLKRFEQALPAIQAQVEKNLVAVPANPRWQERLNRNWRPRVDTISLRMKGADLFVRLERGSEIKRAQLTVISPAANGAELSDLAGAILRTYGVRQPLLTSLVRENGVCTAHSGVFSVFVRPKR